LKILVRLAKLYNWAIIVFGNGGILE